MCYFYGSFYYANTRASIRIRRLVRGEEAEVIASTVALESAFKGFKGDDNKCVKADEQTRVDTLVRALKRLPEGELSHYGLTASQLEQTFTPGTQETENLFKAWTIRQEELKKAVESMMKPAEYMQELVEYIVPSYSGLQKRWMFEPCH